MSRRQNVFVIDESSPAEWAPVIQHHGYPRPLSVLGLPAIDDPQWVFSINPLKRFLVVDAIFRIANGEVRADATLFRRRAGTGRGLIIRRRSSGSRCWGPIWRGCGRRSRCGSGSGSGWSDRGGRGGVETLTLSARWPTRNWVRRRGRGRRGKMTKLVKSWQTGRVNGLRSLGKPWNGNGHGLWGSHRLCLLRRILLLRGELRIGWTLR